MIETLISGYLMFSLGTDYKWSYIFEVMETNKVFLRLKDYSVSQTTLEQVQMFPLNAVLRFPCYSPHDISPHDTFPLHHNPNNNTNPNPNPSTDSNPNPDVVVNCLKIKGREVNLRGRWVVQFPIFIVLLTATYGF